MANVDFRKLLLALDEDYFELAMQKTRKLLSFIGQNGILSNETSEKLLILFTEENVFPLFSRDQIGDILNAIFKEKIRDTNAFLYFIAVENELKKCSYSNRALLYHEKAKQIFDLSNKCKKTWSDDDLISYLTDFLKIELALHKQGVNVSADEKNVIIDNIDFNITSKDVRIFSDALYNSIKINELINDAAPEEVPKKTGFFRRQDISSSEQQIDLSHRSLATIYYDFLTNILYLKICQDDGIKGE